MKPALLTIGTVNGNALKALQKFYEKVSDLAENEISSITFKHDDWCKFLNNKGECDCDPEVVWKKPTRN
jgi:hypothetical protein